MTGAEFWTKVGEAAHAIGAFVKKHWRGLLYVLVGIAGVIFGIEGWRRLKVIFAKVDPKTIPGVPWMRVDGEPGSIAVQVPGTTRVQIIPLPAGHTAENVNAVGYEKDKQIICVEVTHETVNRRSAAGDDVHAGDVRSQFARDNPADGSSSGNGG